MSFSPTVVENELFMLSSKMLVCSIASKYSDVSSLLSEMFVIKFPFSSLFEEETLSIKLSEALSLSLSAMQISLFSLIVSSSVLDLIKFDWLFSASAKFAFNSSCAEILISSIVPSMLVGISQSLSAFSCSILSFSSSFVVVRFSSCTVSSWLVSQLVALVEGLVLGHSMLLDSESRIFLFSISGNLLNVLLTRSSLIAFRSDGAAMSVLRSLKLQENRFLLYFALN